MKVTAFLVLVAKRRGRVVRVSRVTQRRPSLAPDEALVRLELDVPDDVFEAPLLTVPIQRRSIAVGIEVDEPL